MIDAIFKMVGSNPASILIVGGFLFLLLGILGSASGIQILSQMIVYGFVFIILGIGLHLLWLRRN